MRRYTLAVWLARVALATVFLGNLTCAVRFVARPCLYAPAFELEGVPGQAMVRGMGVLFLMWNVTYPLAIWRPWRWRLLFVVILVQQAVGLGGELWMLATLPEGHDSLAATGRRFAAFDGVGFLAMAAAFSLLCIWRSAVPSGTRGAE